MKSVCARGIPHTYVYGKIINSLENHFWCDQIVMQMKFIDFAIENTAISSTRALSTLDDVVFF